MNVNIGLRTSCNDNNYYDITHSFKMNSFTYHILGLRKDRPTYGNTYYIFNCHDCTEAQSDNIVSVNKHHIPQLKETCSPKLRGRSHSSLITQRRFEKQMISIEQSISKMIQTEHHSLVTSLRESIRTENETLLQSIKESSKRIEKTIVNKQSTQNITSTNEHQTIIESFRKELKEEYRSFFESTKVQEKVLIDESTKSLISKDELFRLFEEQRNSLESIYEKQIQKIDTSIDRITETVSQQSGNEQESSPVLNQYQLTLIQTVQKELQQITSKTLEKFESITLANTQINNTTEINTENHHTTLDKNYYDLLNRLFTEQRNFLVETIKQQQTVWSKQLQAIVLEAVDINNTKTIAHTTINNNITNSDSLSVNVAIAESNNLTNSQMNSDTINSNKNVLSASDQHLIKVSMRTPEPVRLHAKFFVGGDEYPEKSHTLCQQDPNHSDQVTCYVAPPSVNGPYNIIIYAKTKTDTAYRAAISIRLPGPNIAQTNFFPYTFPSFELHKCVLIQPLESFMRHNTIVLIHLIVPDASEVKIQNGNDAILLSRDEYKNGVVKKQIEVHGDVYVYGRWKKETDFPICFYYVI